jgi:hypothetical protein
MASIKTLKRQSKSLKSKSKSLKSKSKSKKMRGGNIPKPEGQSPLKSGLRPPKPAEEFYSNKRNRGNTVVKQPIRIDFNSTKNKIIEYDPQEPQELIKSKSSSPPLLSLRPIIQQVKDAQAEQIQTLLRPSKKVQKPLITSPQPSFGVTLKRAPITSKSNSPTKKVPNFITEIMEKYT